MDHQNYAELVGIAAAAASLYAANSKTIIPLRINVLPVFQRLLLPQSHFSSASQYPVRGKG